jgi:hypothetical protein
MVLETPMLLMGFESKSNMDSGMFYGIQKGANSNLKV